MSTEPEDTVRADPVILIVDDHDVVRHALRDRIGASFPEYRCVEAQSGEEAVTCAARSMPAIVLMDIEMPGVNGIDAARRIHTDCPDTHIVMLSIHDRPTYRAQAAAAGASAFVSKRSVRTQLMPLLARLTRSGWGDRPPDAPT